MHMRWRQTALGAVAVAAAQNVTCPYILLNASRIFVSGPLCHGHPGDSCIVDNKCTIKRTKISFVDASDGIDHTNIDGDKIGMSAVDAIGDLSYLNTTGFAVVNFSRMNLDAIEFGTTLKDFVFESVPIPVASVRFPSQMTHLAFYDTATVNIPSIPPECPLVDFKFSHQPLNVSSLERIPPTVRILELENNSVTELAYLNWTRLSHVYLPKNPLRTMVNVTFQKGVLQALVLSGAAMTNVILDGSSFDALDALSPYQGLSGGAIADNGFVVKNSLINQDPALCATACGVVKELWAKHSSMTKQRFTVCVVGPHASASTSASRTYVIVGVTVGLVVAGVVAFVLCNRRNARSARSQDGYRRQGTATKESTATTANTQNVGIDMSELTLYRLDQQDVIPQSKLASGAFADVLYGTYKGIPVAVKKLLSSRVGVNEVQGLIDEIKLLASFTSPYIIKLIGCCWDQPSDLECVLEYMNAGDLRDNLITRDSVEFPWNEKLKVIAAVVDGLAYLHSFPVIHRDLKSRNVLMDTVKPAKLTDFGVSKEDTQETMTVGVGTYRWMAPEILQFNHYSVAADIFSFGMVLSELDSHKIPYADVTNPKNGKPLVDTAIMGMVITGTIKPTFSDDMPEWIRDMAEQCISFNPEDRPTAMVLSHIVHKLLKRSTAR